LLPLWLTAFCAARGASWASQAATSLSSQLAKEASKLIAEGFERLAQHDAVGAEAAFRAAIDAQPEAQPAHRGLGLVLRAMGQWDAALRELQTATRLDPSDADAHAALGMVAWILSAQPAAQGSTAAKFSPADFRAWRSYTLMLAALRTGWPRPRKR
jgi:Tfp pilus assembly protein PilF